MTIPKNYQSVLAAQRAAAAEPNPGGHPFPARIAELGDGLYDPREKLLWEIEITPEMANRWMQRNLGNREQNSNNAIAIAAAIENGTWHKDASAIRFDWYGRLIDGQHRLGGILLTSKSAVVEVITGCDPRAQRYMDIGPRRRLHQRVNLAGEDADLETRKAWAAMCRGWHRHVAGGRTQPTPEQAEKIAESHHTAIDWIVRRSQGVKAAGLCRSPLKVALAEMFEIDPIRAEEFASRVYTGAGIANENDPANRLRVLLLQCGRVFGRVGVKVTDEDVYLRAKSAYVAFLEGRTLDKLYAYGQKSRDMKRKAR